jgi:hypothetical protein
MISFAGVPSTFRMPSSSFSRDAASSKRAAAASHGFFSFSDEIETDEVGDVTVSLLQLARHSVVK